MTQKLEVLFESRRDDRMSLKRPSVVDSVPSVGEGLGFFSAFCFLFTIFAQMVTHKAPVQSQRPMADESSLCDRLVPSRAVTAGSSAQTH